MNDKDMTEKTLEAFNDVFCDILNVLIFDGENVVKEDSLEQATPRSIYKAAGKLREQERDTAKYWKDMNIRIALWGLENETEPENDLPLRVIGYDGAAYRDQIQYVSDENGIERQSLLHDIRWSLWCCISDIKRDGINQRPCSIIWAQISRIN